jgi:hypothetical protein
MATCLTLALSDIGITGNLSATPKPALDPLVTCYLSFILVRLVGSVAILFLLRRLWAKA